MTATHVNGVEVVADEPTEAPMRARDGSTIMWNQTRTLLLANGDTIFGCVHCDYTSANVLSIRPHLNRHNRQPKAKGETGDLSLNQLVRKLAEFDAVVDDRDRWKRRALDAEKRLRTLRTALGGAA